ncbi:MAG: hypothetical protein Q27BB25_06635 [Blastomonas sp. CACIA14H2]|uniref:sugar phosphate isomerase/epimerase family protein n=1 Tax=Blastomonas sp. CACIA14H2 TaxID=1419876 RepID=UPI0003D0134C|nr:MAG: hypothetical protein Q27BB25_06635 [Blastomonas sp. CACIA14H2]
MANKDQIASEWMHAGPCIPFAGRMWSSWSFRSRVQELGRVGFAGIGLFHDDLANVLDREAEGTTQQERLRWMKRILDDNGISIVELEFLTGWVYPVGHPRRDGEQPIRELLMAAASELGARHIKVGNIDGTPFDVDYLRETFGGLCAEAASTGAMIGMEILPPDANSRTIADALAWAGGHPNGGLFLDTWHINNIPTISYADLASIPADALVGVELDDGLAFDEHDHRAFSKIGAPGFIEMTCNMRRIPGEGDYDVIGFIKAVAATGYDGPWGNEILSEEYRRLPMEVAYRRVHRATRQHLDRAMDIGGVA